MSDAQSGSGLGFKLTPAYLLQMCIAFCSLKHGTAALKKLLINIATEIKAVIEVLAFLYLSIHLFPSLHPFMRLCTHVSVSQCSHVVAQSGAARDVSVLGMQHAQAHGRFVARPLCLWYDISSLVLCFVLCVF